MTPKDSHNFGLLAGIVVGLAVMLVLVAWLPLVYAAAMVVIAGFALHAGWER